MPTQPDGSSESGSLPRLPRQLSPVMQPIRPSNNYPPPPILSTDRFPPSTSSSRILVSDAKLPLPPNVHLDSFQISENMKCTAALSGATFVQPACIDYEGKKALVFPFSVRISSWSKVCSHMTRAPMQDLAVKIEGDFFLRYRIFDLFARTASLADIPVQAECHGGPFRIYSTKEFPGLQPSTELSKVT